MIKSIIENPLKTSRKGRFRIIERTAQRQAVLADFLFLSIVNIYMQIFKLLLIYWTWTFVRLVKARSLALVLKP